MRSHRSASRSELARFQRTISRRLGLSVDESREAYVGEVLQRRAEAASVPCAEYLDSLESEQGRSDELRELAAELTIGETYFFRHVEQFHALSFAVLPFCAEPRPATVPLRLLSAGCSSGEEPYTLAILLQAFAEQTGRRFEVYGLDVNPRALERARRGRYSSWALRETAADVAARWFTEEGRDFVLKDVVRSAVTFVEGNLVEPSDLLRPNFFDVIFCRNVLMYFPPDRIRATVARLREALTPSGFLFLGHAETLRGISRDFHLRHTHGTFYYQRSDAPAELRSRATADAQPPKPATLPPPESSDWVDLIRESSLRVEKLHRNDSTAASNPPPPPVASRQTRTDEVFRLLRQERFGEALDAAGELPDVDADADADALLLRAALLVHNDRIEAAEAVCARLLKADELHAGAHYVLALCREARGDGRGADEHNRIALYLDETFAMPRLHLGISARRAGDVDTARRELERAVLLLLREDSSRLLLFGGGFSRDALIALCRAELLRCGETP